MSDKHALSTKENYSKSSSAVSQHVDPEASKQSTTTKSTKTSTPSDDSDSGTGVQNKLRPLQLPQCRKLRGESPRGTAGKRARRILADQMSSTSVSVRTTVTVSKRSRAELVHYVTEIKMPLRTKLTTLNRTHSLTQ